VALVAGLRRRAGSPLGDAPVCLVIFGAGCLTSAFEWTWELPASYAPVIIAAALLAGRATITSEPDAEAEAEATTSEQMGAGCTRVQPRRLGWGLATLAYGGMAICVAAVLLIAEVNLDNSRDAFDRGDLEAAAQAAEEAIARARRLNPRIPRPAGRLPDSGREVGGPRG